MLLTQPINPRLDLYLDNEIFPCSRLDILMCAEDNNAPDYILDFIETIPNICYRNIKEIEDTSSDFAHAI